MTITTTADSAAVANGAGTGVGTSAGGSTLLGSWRARHSADLGAHLAHHGPIPLPGPGDTSWADRFAAAIEASGITGRGGAAFPSSAKLALARAGRAGPTLVVNAMEGEPASGKDQALLSCVPHLVLDGAQLVAAAIGAGRIALCIPADRYDTALAASRAVAERAGTGLMPVAVTVVRPPGRYVAGEESALASWLDGGPGAPTFRPRKGVALTIGRRPALVHNAETLAHMALVARYGPDAFRAAGRPGSPGSTLVTVTGGVEHPGVYEIALGTPLAEVVGWAHPVDEVQAVLTGGFGGSWLPAAALGTAYAPGPMAAVGGVVGAGVLVVLPRTACGIAETARIARYMAGESAGQCGPCVFGLPAIAQDLAWLASGRADAGLTPRLEGRFGAVNGRGACRHPDGVVRMARSALSVFAGDAAAHASGRPCLHHARPSLLPPATARP